MAIVDYVEAAFPGIVQSAQQDTTWGLKKIGAHNVWSGAYGPSSLGQLANITILDTGVDETHRWYGDGPENMYLDCYWISTTGSTACYDDFAPSNPRRGHGAHVAGVIASRDNSVGYVGVTPSIGGFASIKVCRPDGMCLPGDVASGMDWALNSGRARHIVNISLGYCQNYTVLQQFVANMAAANILVVASAGNTVYGATLEYYCQGQANNLGSSWPTAVMFPARYPQALAVSGTLENDAFPVAQNPGGGGGGGGPDWCGEYACATASGTCIIGSRYGQEVDISAPFQASSMTMSGQYTTRCGTSFSAPFVAGVAALVWTRNPTFTATQVRQRLTSTAVALFPATQFGAGRVHAVTATYGPPFTAMIAGPTLINVKDTYTWTAEASGGSGGYSYSWSVHYPSGQSYSLGTAQSVQLTVFAGTGDFELRVTVTSGGQSIEAMLAVDECIGGGCGPL